MLTIEDGSIVANANSFTTDAEFTAYAAARGFDLPATEAERDQLQILAVDYIFSVESQLQGKRTSDEQELSFPRLGMYARDKNTPSNFIPKDIKKAQMELAIQANNNDLLVNASVQNVASEKVDVIETSYFNGGSWASVQTGRADAYLDPYLKSGGGVRLVRI